MQENNGRAIKPPVLVRSWGDQPVVLFLHRIENNRSFVANLESYRPIGLPHEQVFEYDQDKFEALSTAYQQKDGRRLGEFWANMTVDDFACNKYKIILECSHDQEHVTDSERPSDSDSR